jgi:hypothetical protein
VVGAAIAGMWVFRLVSERADKIRKHDENTANKLDQYRFGNRAAVPMRISGFDKPR